MVLKLFIETDTQYLKQNNPQLSLLFEMPPEHFVVLKKLSRTCLHLPHHYIFHTKMDDKDTIH